MESQSTIATAAGLTGPRFGAKLERMKGIWALGLAAGLVASVLSAADAQSAVQAYQRALAQVCQRQVTPELVRLYQEALKEMEASGKGYGRDSNFHGLRDPYLAYNDCWQMPSLPR